MSDQTRRHWRRRLLLAGLAPLLLALLLAGKVAAMSLHDRDGRAAYRAGDFAAARSAFASNSTLNYLQAWVAPFDEGTTRYRLEDFPGAIRLLEEALEVVPADSECLVRINLALSHEAVGDAAATGGDVAAAGGRWRQGVDVLAASDCLESGAVEPQRADARTVDERLRSKLRQPGQAPTDPPAEEPESPEQAQAEELADRTERAERQRRKAEQRRQDREDEQAPDGEAPTYEW